MKYLRLIIIMMFVLALNGCATSSYSVGKNFPSENVSKIIKSKTTSEDMISLFGEPYTKTVISASDEKWIYMYSESKAKAHNYLVTMDIKTTGTQKMLDVLITNGVVANFAFTEGQTPTIQVD